MALTVTTDPNKTISTYDSYTVSTSQIRYVLTESSMTGKTNYYVKITVDAFSTTLTLYYFMPSSGVLTIDIGKAMEYALLVEGVNFIYYRITAQAFYSGTSDTAINSDYSLAVISRVQILTEHGANLYKYVAKTGTTQTGYFLTMFDRPGFWEGWTKKMYWINQDLSTTYDLISTVRNINGTQLSFTADTKIPTARIIEEYELVYPSDAGKYTLDFVVQSGLVVTKTIYLLLNDVCKNPVYIEWFNSLGGYDTWMFEHEQTINNDVEPGIIWEQGYTTDIETVSVTKKRRAAKDVQIMTLKAANLTQNQLQALHDIKRSNDVRVWLEEEGATHVNVIVNSGYSTSFTTGKQGYEFTLTIEFPDNFDFFKAKQY